jgi:uncharacterized membrane protein (DUF441 family)
MKEIILKIIARIDGNKTIICTGAVTVIAKMVELGIFQNTPTVQLITWGLTALGIGALGHHVQKGYFGTEKGK